MFPLCSPVLCSLVLCSLVLCSLFLCSPYVPWFYVPPMFPLCPLVLCSLVLCFPGPMFPSFYETGEHRTLFKYVPWYVCDWEHSFKKGVLTLFQKKAPMLLVCIATGEHRDDPPLSLGQCSLYGSVTISTTGRSPYCHRVSRSCISHTLSQCLFWSVSNVLPGALLTDEDQKQNVRSSPWWQCLRVEIWTVL